MPRIIAIDYGLKRVGIAITDNLQIIASGLTTVSKNDLFSFLKNYFAEEEVESIVLGYPLNWDESPTDLTPHVLKLKEKLEKTYPDKPIFLVDERNSSKQAMQSLIQSGVKKSKRRNKALLDEVSATIILQDYMASIG